MTLEAKIIAREDNGAIAKLDQASLLISQAKTIDEAFTLKALFKAAEVEARRRGLTEVEQKSIEYKFWVNDKIGALLIQMKESGERATAGQLTSHTSKRGSMSKEIRTLKDLGISSTESSRLQKFHNLPQIKKEEIIETAKRRVERAKQTIIDESLQELERENPEPIDIPETVSISIIKGDFQRSDQASDSIDLIVTDPPYGREYLNVWQPLGIFAKNILKPSGFLLCYTGQKFLPEKMINLSYHLKYFWTLAIILSGDHTRIHPEQMFCQWKPCAVYQKQPFKPAPNFISDVVQEARATDHKELQKYHDWGQDIGDLVYLLENFSKPGDTIFEPFAGGGSTIQACIETKRNCIAYEIDPKAYRILKKRFPDSN